MEKTLTTKAVCELLSCSRRTLNRYIARGLLSPVRLSPRRNVFLESDVDRMLKLNADRDAEMIRNAHQVLDEVHAEEDRLLCPSCSKRRVNRGRSICTPCEEQRELQLAHKRKWWDKHGAENRAARRRAEAGTDVELDEVGS